MEIGFIEKALLQQWQEIVISRSGRDLPWERFRGFVHRVYEPSDNSEVDRILNSVPLMLEKVHAHINDSEIQAFRSKAIEDFLKTANRYLDEGKIT